MKNLLLLFFIASSFCASSQKKKTKLKPVSAKFSIQIQGRLEGSCNKSTSLLFGEFHGSDHDLQSIDVNENGEFTATFLLAEPGVVYIKKGMYSQYFIVSAKEKTYKMELNCSNDMLNRLQINNSAENKAYQDFLNLRKKLTADIEMYRTKKLSCTLGF